MAITLTIEALELREVSLPEKIELPFISVGRSKSSTKILAHPELSRHHFFIKYEEGRYYLVDENSSHGTLIDGRLLNKGEELELGSTHLIEIPGHRITLQNDHKKPTLEHTQTLARRLLDKSVSLIGDETHPRLSSMNFKQTFVLDATNMTFSIGSSLSNDFVITSPLVHKNHVTLSRDLNGINIIPALGKEVRINGQPITTMVTLNHGDIISLNQYELLFQLFVDEHTLVAKNTHPNEENLAHLKTQPLEFIAHEQNSESVKAKRLGQNTDLQDKILCATFFTAFFGALIIVWQLV